MFLAEIDSSQIASLTVTNPSTPALVQLSAGGTALLSVPSAPLISGRLFRIILAGNAQISSGGGTANLTFYLGNSTATPLASAGSVSLGTDSGSGFLTNNFVAEVELVWDSVSQQIIQLNSSTTIYSISSQSSLTFSVGATRGGSGADPIVALTEFKLELI